jgi:hypothetical protein
MPIARPLIDAAPFGFALLGKQNPGNFAVQSPKPASSTRSVLKHNLVWNVCRMKEAGCVPESCLEALQTNDRSLTVAAL